MSINTFQAEIGAIFKNQNVLKEAITHRSYLNENPDWPLPHNERLEFLGDAVLELAVTNYLFKHYPKLEEGELTQIRAALVNTKMLAETADSIGLRKVLLVSKGEQQSGERSVETITADAFEALVGAIYIDQGYERAEEFVRRYILNKTDDVRRRGVKDAKSALQEEVQGRYKVTPTYEIIEQEGPEHFKTFTAGVYFGGELVAEGKGPSKQEAELAAATAAINQLKKDEA